MPRNEDKNTDAEKTAMLLAAGNLLLAPLYWADSRLGLSAAVIGTTAFLYGAHEMGKNRRPVGNIVNKVNSFFGSKTGDPSTELQNAAENIMAGGAAMYNELVPAIKPH